jgi:Cys-Gly metallodipeptidase DUG1
MTDLIQLMSRLVTPQGDILVPGIQELVAPLGPGEKYVSPMSTLSHMYSVLSSCLLILAPHRDRYDVLDYSIADVEHSAGASIALSNDKSTVLMGRMREPSLSLHGIEGAFSAPGGKTVIPARVSGKFSIRLVPDQTPDLVDPLVIKYLEAEFAKLGTKNKLVIECLSGGKPWVADPDHWNYKAAAKATKVSL